MQEHAQEVHQLKGEVAQGSASLSGMTSDSQELKVEPSDASLDLASLRQDHTQAHPASTQDAQVCLVWSVNQCSHMEVHPSPRHIVLFLTKWQLQY